MPTSAQPKSPESALPTSGAGSEAQGGNEGIKLPVPQHGHLPLCAGWGEWGRYQSLEPPRDRQASCTAGPQPQAPGHVPDVGSPSCE